MTDKPKWLQNLVEFLIDNITILLTIGFAGYVIYRHEIAQLSVSVDELLTAILGVLGLLAISEIVERYRRLDSIGRLSKRTLSLLEDQFASRPSAIAFFQKPQSIDTYVQRADHIDLCGVTLTSTINKQLSNLRERLKEGADIRILIADPNSLALQMSALRSEDSEDVDYYQKRLEAALNDVEWLHRNWLEYQRAGGKKGSFSARLLAYAPSFSILSFDSNRPNGSVFVEVFTHKSGFKSPPTFDLTFLRDGQWYGYFVSQFEEMWQDAKPWKSKVVQHSSSSN